MRRISGEQHWEITAVLPIIQLTSLTFNADIMSSIQR